MDEYESIILLYDSDCVVAFQADGRLDSFGFMWKADLGNKEVLESVIARNNRTLEVDRGIWKQMDELLAKRKTENMC